MKHTFLSFIVLLLGTLGAYAQSSPCTCNMAASCDGSSYATEAAAVAAFTAALSPPNQNAAGCYSLVSSNIPSDDGQFYQFCYEYVHNSTAPTFAVVPIVFLPGPPAFPNCISATNNTPGAIYYEVYNDNDCGNALPYTDLTPSSWPYWPAVQNAHYRVCVSSRADVTACATGQYQSACFYAHPYTPPGCNASGGTVSAQNTLSLCDGTNTTLSTSNAVPPSGLSNPSLAWGVWVLSDPLNAVPTPNGGLPADQDPTINTPDANFVGLTVGSTLNLTGDGTGATYYIAPLWVNINGQGQPVIDPTCTGLSASQGYTVTMVPDISGTATSVCSGSGSININIVFSGGTPLLNGSQFTITGSGVGGNLANNGTYTLTNVLNGTSYSVTATDANGCSFTVAGTAQGAITVNVTTTPISCFGGNNGSITATPSGGSTPYTYTWSPAAANTPTLNNRGAGTYNLTVTDATGCSASTSVTLSNPPQLTAQASVISNYNGQDVSCATSADGVAQITANGGTGAYTYTWSPNVGTAATVAGLTAGLYSYTVNDENSCSVTGSIVLTAPPAFVLASSTHTDATCAGLSNGSVNVQVAGGTGSYTYTWSPNIGSTGIINSLAGGTYDVTVSDQNGCTVTASETIAAPIAVTATAQVTSNYNGVDISCAGATDGAASVLAVGGTPPYTYNWGAASTQTTASVSNLAAGSYTVTVTDLNGCANTASVTLSAPAPLTVNLIQSNAISCVASLDGSIQASAQGGTLPYTYTWTANANGQTVDNPTNLGAGLYALTLTDANGCSSTANITISDPPTLLLSAVVSTDFNGFSVGCAGGDNGIATASASGGGGGPYTFAWSNGANTPQATNLTAGSYTVTVTDNNGCSTTTSISLNEPTALVATASLVNNISCNGQTDGALQASASGGISPYSYLWNTNNIQPQLTGLAAGSYTVTVTDANGCMATASETVIEPTVLQLQVNVQNATCQGVNNGTATVNVSGGTSPYTYTWNNGQQVPTAISLASGNYTVTVSDANGCTRTTTATVGEASPILAQVLNVQSVSCANNVCDGNATVNATGGLGAFTYTWSSGELGQSATNLCAGSNSVTVSDNVGCFAVVSFNVGAPSPISVSGVNSTPVSCYGGSNGSFTISPAGGSPQYTFSWYTQANTLISTTSGFVGTINDLSAGTYLVSISDANGCSLPAIPFTVTQPNTPLTATATGSNVSCAGGSDGSVTVNPAGGTPSYAYQWDPSAGGQNTQTAFNVVAGTYTVTVTDANGCTTTTQVSITEPTTIEFEAVADSTTCYGDNDGSISFQSTLGGTPPYTYSLDGTNFTTDTLLQGLAGGEYTVYVEDANGCQVSSQLVVPQPPQLIVDLGADIEIDLADSTRLNAIPNTLPNVPITFTWSAVPADATMSCTNCQQPVVHPLSTTTYTVTITDPNGCQATDEITVRVDKNRNIYIPNAFSPDGDGTNDYFMVYGGGGVSNIRLMRVFDRWGELLFEDANFQPNSAEHGWNGLFRNKKCNPGVFVYYIEAEFIDGEMIEYKGDVTLVR
jgi:gliding motility-associated-like protein